MLTARVLKARWQLSFLVQISRLTRYNFVLRTNWQVNGLANRNACWKLSSGAVAAPAGYDDRSRHARVLV